MPFNFPNNPTTGQYSRQNNRVYKWNGYSWDLASDNLSVSVLVVGGGGSGGSGGASATIGAGGGGGAVVEQTVYATLDSAITVTVGAGGAGSVTNSVRSSHGSASRFDSVMAIGGGSGGINDTNGSYAPYVRPGGNGANGGGRSWQGGGSDLVGVSITGLGFSGGGGDGFNSGGGGGAGTVGGTSGPGGNGKVSTITGLTYAGGGGGGRQGSAGGTGGGGRGGSSGVAAVAGTANTGGGGGGAFAASTATGTGGSGVVVLRFDATLTITLSAGLSYSVAFVDNQEIVTITQGTGTVTFTV
jgi:hypothetical protein